MPRLTALDVFNLSAEYSNVAGKINDYLIDNFATLDDSDKMALQLKSAELRDWSNKLALASGTLAKREMGDAVASVKGATENMKDAFDQINAVGKILNLVGAMVTFAGAVISAQPGAIISSGADLGTTIAGLAGGTGRGGAAG
jgi:hypothetical protein